MKKMIMMMIIIMMMKIKNDVDNDVNIGYDDCDYDRYEIHDENDDKIVMMMVLQLK
jgi:hypothetical protein